MKPLTKAELKRTASARAKEYCADSWHGLSCSDLLSLQVLLGGHGVWTPELEKELVGWINARPREIICTKCWIREQKGEQPKADF